MATVTDRGRPSKPTMMAPVTAAVNNDVTSNGADPRRS